MLGDPSASTGVGPSILGLRVALALGQNVIQSQTVTRDINNDLYDSEEERRRTIREVRRTIRHEHQTSPSRRDSRRITIIPRQAQGEINLIEAGTDIVAATIRSNQELLDSLRDNGDEWVNSV